ncbi:unnamed protein product [marine sediment metagenome]|uniref:Uncharacterized protein n=1 Tax=marine sediment metagenome TaxID=412755 RepID=X1A2X1_9ZZZZ
MAKKCCLYEKGDSQYNSCTTDPNCPELVDWTLIGSWGVDDCKDCRGGGDGMKLKEWVLKNWEILS